jgi:hypothetical protein
LGGSYEGMSFHGYGASGLRVRWQGQVHIQFDKKWIDGIRNLTKTISIYFSRARASSSFGLLDFWLSKGLSGEAVVVLLGASGAQPKSELGRCRRRWLRLGQIRTQHHIHIQQNRLRQATSLYLRSTCAIRILHIFYISAFQVHNNGSNLDAFHQAECMGVWNISICMRLFWTR